METPAQGRTSHQHRCSVCPQDPEKSKSLMSCSIHYTCPKSQQCRRHGPGRARGRGHAVGDQAEEEGEEATEIGERDEDGDSDSDADGDGDSRGDAGAVRGKAVDAEDEEGAEDEERE